MDFGSGGVCIWRIKMYKRLAFHESDQNNFLGFPLGALSIRDDPQSSLEVRGSATDSPLFDIDRMIHFTSVRSVTLTLQGRGGPGVLVKQ